MNKSIARVIMASGVIAALSTPAFAQATRTWVSGVGDDANPCSRTAPCKTFAGAISKTAAGGIISVLDPGGFGAITITKSITIDGGGTEGSITASLTQGVIINALSTDHVNLRNLTIYGVGNGTNGIRVFSASRVTIQNVTISGFNTGIEYNANGTLDVSDSFIHNNRSLGVYFRSGKGTFDRVRFENNALDGLRVGTGGTATVKRSVASGHANIGFSATDAASARLTVDDCLVNNNAYGIGAAMGATIHVSANTISNNTVNGVWQDGSSFLVSLTNNRMMNNAANVAFTSSIVVQ